MNMTVSIDNQICYVLLTMAGQSSYLKGMSETDLNVQLGLNSIKAIKTALHQLCQTGMVSKSVERPHRYSLTSKGRKHVDILNAIAEHQERQPDGQANNPDELANGGLVNLLPEIPQLVPPQSVTVPCIRGVLKYRFALWSDGDLSIMGANTEINISADQVREIYLTLHQSFSRSNHGQ